MAFTNYAMLGEKGAWEVEHSQPRAYGGSNHLNNLFAACIPCNREKGTRSSRSTRRWYGEKRVPLSREKRRALQEENFLWGLGFGVLALMLIAACSQKKRPSRTRGNVMTWVGAISSVSCAETGNLPPRITFQTEPPAVLGWRGNGPNPHGAARETVVSSWAGISDGSEHD